MFKVLGVALPQWQASMFDLGFHSVIAAYVKKFVVMDVEIKDRYHSLILLYAYTFVCRMNFLIFHRQASFEASATTYMHPFASFFDLINQLRVIEWVLLN